MSNKSTPLALQGQLLDRLTQLLAASANELSRWDEIFYDVRYVDDCALERTVVRDGANRIPIHALEEVCDIRDTLWDLRNEIPNNQWFGLLIRITNEGKCDVRFNYDPNCIDTFAADEKAHKPF